MKSTDYKLQILLTIFISCLLLGNLLGNKLIEIFGIITSVGLLGYPPTFLITDIIEEVKGKEVTRTFVNAGLLSLCIAFLFVSLSTGFPPASIYHGNEAYTEIFSSSRRMIVASMTAFFISQHHDILAFNFWKQKTNGRHLWLRNNLSTIVSQLIDSTVFMFLAFYRLTPEINAATVIQMVLPLWVLKIGFALLDTPFVYLGVRWLAPRIESSIPESGKIRKSNPVEVETGPMPEKSLDS
jgi:queuosine precursor transporter